MLGGAGGADRLQAELRAASRYGTGAAPQPSRASSPACEDLPGSSDDGAMRGVWSYRQLRHRIAAEPDGYAPDPSREASSHHLRSPRRVTAAVSPASRGSRRGGRRAAGLAWGRRRRDGRLPRRTGRGRAAQWYPSTAPATGRAGRNGWPALSRRSPPSSRRPPRSPAHEPALSNAGEAEGGPKVGRAHRIPVLHAPGDPERGRPSDFSQTCARCPASGRSCPPRKRPGAGSDFGRSSRWPGAAGWRPRGGGAARPARGVARKLPAASGATFWPRYA